MADAIESCQIKRTLAGAKPVKGSTQLGWPRARGSSSPGIWGAGHFTSLLFTALTRGGSFWRPSEQLSEPLMGTEVERERRVRPVSTGESLPAALPEDAAHPGTLRSAPRAYTSTGPDTARPSTSCRSRARPARSPRARANSRGLAASPRFDRQVLGHDHDDRNRSSLDDARLREGDPPRRRSPGRWRRWRPDER